MSENTVANTKMSGLRDTVSCIPSKREMTTGTNPAPTKYPPARPMGMPTSESRYACRRIMRRICRPVVPMVLSSP